MPPSDHRNRPAAADTVEQARGELTAGGDGRAAEVTNGRWRGTTSTLLSRYGWVALLIVGACAVNVLTALQHGIGPATLARPLLDESTSALVLMALLPILKRSVDLLATTHDRRIAVIVAALAIVAYALLHVGLMVGLRASIYPAFGDRFDFNWRDQFLGEFRKDIISAFMIMVVLWLIDRRAAQSAPAREQAVAVDETDAKQPVIWLKDGTTSVRVDPRDVIAVTSAGNYVEFSLPDQRYLIRGTLSGEEARLKPFGFSRVHRTKLVNTSRIAAIDQRPNGDFALRMDGGETIVGSRRYRDAIVAIKTMQRSGA